MTTKFQGEMYPGPYLSIRANWRGLSRDVLGLLDSGADQSTIPIVTAHALRLTKIDEILVDDANGGSVMRDVFAVNLEFHGFAVASLPVAATDYAVMLIGRDVLSDLVTEIHGPEATFMLNS